jgi:hypothetical protein
MIHGVLIAIAPFLAWIALEAANPQVMQDWQNKSIRVGSVMTTSARVWIPSLVNTTSTCWQKEWNMVQGSACNYSHPTWNSTSYTIATKISWTTSWVLVCSLPWVQCKRWTLVASMGCVHTHQIIPTIERCGNPSHIHNVVKKDGEDNRKVGKVGWPINQMHASMSKHDKIWEQWVLNTMSKNMLERYDGVNVLRWNV